MEEKTSRGTMKCILRLSEVTLISFLRKLFIYERMSAGKILKSIPLRGRAVG